jgi:hypothetical protein
MFSYYGLTAAALLSLLNYLFRIPGADNIGYTLLEYRLGQGGLVSSFLENITWIPFL